MMKRPPVVRDERGYITLDFIFASLLVAGMFTACFALCLTLSMVEVAQYMTFSSARAAFSGHISVAAQRSLGQRKWAQLAGSAPYKQLFFQENSLFSLGAPQVGDFNSEFPYDIDADNATFIGARSRFRAKALEFSIPMWGSVAPPEDGGFYANVTTYLSREPNDDECASFVDTRFGEIRKLDPAYASGLRFVDKYRRIADNGC